MTLELFLIALMIVFATDIAQFPQSLLEIVWRYAYKSRPFPEDLTWTSIHPALKIMECSLCQTWWVTLIVIICCGCWSVPMMAYCMFLAYLTPILKDFLWVARDFLGEMIATIANYFGL